MNGESQCVTEFGQPHDRDGAITRPLEIPTWKIYLEINHGQGDTDISISFFANLFEG